MQCARCMRGPAQNVDMSKEIVDLFFDKLKPYSMDELTFGGGEPTLNPEIFSYTIDRLIKDDIYVDSLGMVTNGQIYSEEIADALNRYEEFANRRQARGMANHTKICFSVDSFHKPFSKEVRSKYEKVCRLSQVVDHELGSIIKTGYATVGLDYVHKLPKSDFMTFLGNNISIFGFIGLSAIGNITTNPCGTYVDGDAINFGYVGDFDIWDYLIKNGRNISDSQSFEDIMKRERKMTQKEDV